MGKNKVKTLVIIPTYNESENIEEIILKLYKFKQRFKLKLHVLVIDDKSPDLTAQIVRKMSLASDFVKLIIRSKKTGIRDAYLEGFEYALKNRYENIVTMDADGSHDPLFIKDLLRYSQLYGLVIGSRYTENGKIKNWSTLRKILSRIGNLYAQLILSSKISDLTGGFNLIKRETLTKIDLGEIRSNGYGFQVELKYRLMQLGAKACEVPITFVDRKKGKSKFNLLILIEAIFTIPIIRIWR